MKRTDLQLTAYEHEQFGKLSKKEGRSKREMVRWIVLKYMKEYKT